MPHRALQFTIFAPAGFATDPPRTRSRRRAHRGARTSRELRPDGAPPLAAFLGAGRRTAGRDRARRGGFRRRRRADAARRIRFHAPRRPDRLRRARSARASAGWAIPISPPSSWRRSRTAGMVTFAGPMAAYDFGARDRRRRSRSTSASACCRTTRWEVECALDGPSGAAQRGTLWGGNLALVAHLAGTPYLPDVAGGILFLEDVGEHPYRVERMLYQLLHAGRLSRQRAILLGAFTEYQLNAERRRLRSGGSGRARSRARRACRSTPACRSGTCPTS